MPFFASSKAIVANLISSFKEIDSIISKNKALEEQVAKYQAFYDIEKLEDEVSDIKTSIKELQSIIDKSNNDISEFNKEIKRAKTEIKKLKKITDEKSLETSE